MIFTKSAPPDLIVSGDISAAVDVSFRTVFSQIRKDLFMDELNNIFPSENTAEDAFSEPSARNTAEESAPYAADDGIPAGTPPLSQPQPVTFAEAPEENDVSPGGTSPQPDNNNDNGYLSAENENKTSPDPFREEDFKGSPSEQMQRNDFGRSYQAAPYPPNMGYPPPYANTPPMQGMNGVYGAPVSGGMNANMNMNGSYGMPPHGAQQMGTVPPPPMYGNFAPDGYPMPSPAPAAPTAEETAGGKRLSVWGTVAVTVTIVALFMALMIFLAIGSGSDSSSDSSVSSSDKDTSVSDERFNPFSEKNDEPSGVVNEIHLPVSPKPVQESKYYEDEESGLLTVAGVAKTVLPSVVDVEIFGETTFYPDSRASGIIISDDGYIITNAHVVSDVGAGIKVTLNDGRDFEAELIGRDSKTDLAVIKIEADDLSPAELGDSDQLEIGEQVAAIGNSGGYSGTLTVGYISGLNREVTVSASEGGSGTTAECIQTDAALSPGVSGGALVNMYGQVVGITTLKYHASELYEGLGFAISMKFAKPIIEDIISQGYISGRVRIGIYYTLVTAEEADFYGISKGILVKEIAQDCDISNTDLRAGDIITAINGRDVYSADSIEASLEGFKPGDTITAHVFRKGITNDDTSEFDIEFKAMQDTNLN